MRATSASADSIGLLSPGTRPPPRHRIAGARVVLIDGDARRAEAHVRLLVARGADEVLVANCGDEALDVLGATLPRVDLVVVWQPIADAGRLDLVGILRRSRLPAVLVVMSGVSHRDCRDAPKLAGAALVESDLSFADLLRLGELDDPMADGETVARIMDARCVPGLLHKGWAWAIYGYSPGERFITGADGMPITGYDASLADARRFSGGAR